MADATWADIEGYLHALLRSGRHGPAALRQRTAAVRALFRYALERPEVVAWLPMAKLAQPLPLPGLRHVGDGEHPPGLPTWPPAHPLASMVTFAYLPVAAWKLRRHRAVTVRKYNTAAAFKQGLAAGQT